MRFAGRRDAIASSALHCGWAPSLANTTLEPGALSEHAGELCLQLTDERGLEQFGHASEVGRSQPASIGIEERERADGGLMPRTAHRVVLGTWPFMAGRAIALLVPWWLRRLGLAATRPRVLSVLGHHHSVEPDLHRDGLIGDNVARAYGRRNDRATQLVARCDRARESAQGRVAQRRRAHLREKLRRLLLWHQRDRARSDARHAGRVHPFDDPQSKVHWNGNPPAPRLLVDAALQRNVAKDRLVFAPVRPPIPPALAIDVDLRSVGVRGLHRPRHLHATPRVGQLLHLTLDNLQIHCVGIQPIQLKAQLTHMPLDGRRIDRGRHLDLLSAAAAYTQANCDAGRVDCSVTINSRPGWIWTHSE